MHSRQIRAIIVGAAGYTGSELVRLLAEHPAVEISAFVSATTPGEDVAARIPHWRGRRAMAFSPLAELPQLAADVVFFATPHGVAMQQAGALLAAGKVVIDLGADFRLKDTAVFKQWYGEHTASELLPQAVYGLPEMQREAIKTANLIACPGCYATAVQLALLPFVAGGHIQGDVIADAKSGTSGAGRQGNRADLLLAEMAGNYKAYGLDGHRHHPEIMQTLAAAADGASKVPPLTFIPHLLPLARGLFASIYFQMADDSAAATTATEVLANHWQGEPFVEVLHPPLTAELSQVVGNNRLIISAHAPQGMGEGGRKRILVCAALDNLLKGAAGQAVQNMNIRFGLDETSGLTGARA